MFDFFSGLGDVAFAFAGHNVVLEIQATIPSTPGKPSKGPMWKGVVIAYLIVAACYFPVAFCGYLVFGNQVEDNVLVSLEKPAYLIVAANAFVLVHVIGSYQVKSFHLSSKTLFHALIHKIISFAGLCNASFRHDGIIFSETNAFQAKSDASNHYTNFLCL